MNKITKCSSLFIQNSCPLIKHISHTSTNSCPMPPNYAPFLQPQKLILPKSNENKQKIWNGTKWQCRRLPFFCEINMYKNKAESDDEKWCPFSPFVLTVNLKIKSLNFCLYNENPNLLVGIATSPAKSPTRALGVGRRKLKEGKVCGFDSSLKKLTINK